MFSASTSIDVSVSFVETYFDSFYIQLYFYGFTRTSSVSHSYRHPSFRKGQLRAVLDIRRKSVKSPGEESEEEKERAATKKRKGLNGAPIRIDSESEEDLNSLEEVDDNDDDDDETEYDANNTEENSLNSTINCQSPTGHVSTATPLISVIVSEVNFQNTLELFRKRKLEGLPLAAISSQLGSLLFPQRLYILLEIESSDCVGWTMNGTTFQLYNTERFMKEICPCYFYRKHFYR